MDKYIGKLLDGRYEVLEIIGIGGMAVVYRAMDHRLNRLVAIKILKDDYSNDAEFRRRFHGESQAVAMMSHPNIVNVYDVSKNEGMDYIVMELIDGITLKQYMEKKAPLSWRETLHFSMQIAKALEHAHSRNIIHRDIKPHNIMILKDGSVKVADFGIARVASSQNTLTKEALGSVHYISPEQARGGRVDNRTDIYSLGVVMYEMLTGRPPYDGETPVSVAIQHINGTPLSPSLLNSSIPTGLEQITMHAMCSDLNIRYASVTDMLKDMEEFRKNPAIRFTFLPQGVSAVSNAPSRPQSNRPAVSKPRQEELEREYAIEDRQERSKRILIVVGIVLAVIALIGLVVLIMSRTSGESSTEPSEEEELIVPQMIGQIWDEVPADKYPGFVFVVNDDSYIYSTEYPEGVICDQSVPAGRPAKPGKEIYLYISKGEQTDKMPDLIKKSEEYAKAYFKALEIKLTPLTEKEYSDDVEEGYVIRTDPEPGATLKAGQIVTIYVSKGPEFKKFKMPSVEGSESSTAVATLEGLKLQVTTREEYSSTVKEGFVISQTPPSGTEVQEGTVVTLVISKGKQTVTMPYVVGYTSSSAQDMLQNLGLSVVINREYSHSVTEDHVINQSYGSGAELIPGTQVTLTVSLGPEPVPTEPSTESTESPIDTVPEEPVETDPEG